MTDAAPTTLVERFRKVVADRPDDIAVTENGTAGVSLTFAELDRWAAGIARYITALQTSGEIEAGKDMIGVRLPRSAGLLASILGIMRAGVAYVPLDPSLPQSRLDYMARVAGIGLEISAEVLSDVALAKSEDTSISTPVPLPKQLAYAIFTSGSTGRPKGVQVSHGSLTNLLSGLEESGLIRASTGRVGWNASPSFDASVQQWIRVCRGDTVVVLGDAVRRDPTRMVDAIVRERLNDLDLTPTHAALLVDLLEERLEEIDGLRLWIGGEPISDSLWERLAKLATSGAVDALNVYGTTETTVDSTYAMIREGTRPNLGVALPGHTVRVLDDNQCPVRPGEVGELCVSGVGTARGYIGQPALTATSFVPDPWSGDGSRMYRTGDRVRLTSELSFEFVGRADRQVKLRGHRIELGEVESLLRECPSVEDCVVLLQELGEDAYLSAFACVAAGATVEEVQEYAEEFIPEWMRPLDFHLIDAIPTTITGKVDRAFLAALSNESSQNLER